jgi:hypothetical protein
MFLWDVVIFLRKPKGQIKKTLETLGTQDAGPFNSVSERFLHVVHVDKHRKQK